MIELTARRLHVRWMIKRDMEECLAADQDGLPPWTEEDFLQALRERNTIGQVCERGDKVLGFVVYELHKRRLEVLRLGVLPGYRRQGVATALVRKLLSKLSEHRRDRVLLDCPERALGAQLFLRTQGFKARFLRRGRGDEDGTIRFEWRLPR